MGSLAQKKEIIGEEQTTFREGIMQMQEQMLGDENNKDWENHVITTDHFAPGVYAREMFIPAGYVVIRKIHKYEHLNIVSQGCIEVATETGVKRIKAPFTFKSPPGVKRAGYAFEDTVWTTIHPTEETDVDKIEDQVIASSFEDYDLFLIEEEKKKQIEGKS